MQTSAPTGQGGDLGGTDVWGGGALGRATGESQEEECSWRKRGGLGSCRTHPGAGHMGRKENVSTLTAGQPGTELCNSPVCRQPVYSGWSAGRGAGPAEKGRRRREGRRGEDTVAGG